MVVLVLQYRRFGINVLKNITIRISVLTFLFTVIIHSILITCLHPKETPIEALAPLIVQVASVMDDTSSNIPDNSEEFFLKNCAREKFADSYARNNSDYTRGVFVECMPNMTVSEFLPKWLELGLANPSRYISTYLTFMEPFYNPFNFASYQMSPNDSSEAGAPNSLKDFASRLNDYVCVFYFWFLLVLLIISFRKRNTQVFLTALPAFFLLPSVVSCLSFAVWTIRFADYTEFDFC
jgi:hypothetical protein